jgi:hypothetical protein
MSYYNLTESDYQRPNAGTPGWQMAPVPGWGINPKLAGPKWIAANGVGDVPIRSIVADWTPVRGMGVSDSEKAGNEGMIALAAAGGIFLGWALAWVFWSNKKRT